MWKKTWKQLIKEFWIPGFVAGGWTTYVVWGGTFTLKTFMGAFGPAFFLASWLTGQIFRIKKQAGVENHLQLLEERLVGLVNKIETETQELLNHITGGDSFCYMTVMADDATWIAIHKGEHHLLNLSARVCDLDASSEYPDWLQLAKSDISIGTLFKDMIHRCFVAPLTGKRRRFNIYYTASNGIFLQELRFKRTGAEQWTFATRVMRTKNDGERVILYEQVRDDFPLEADGTPGY